MKLIYLTRRSSRLATSSSSSSSFLRSSCCHILRHRRRPHTHACCLSRSLLLAACACATSLRIIFGIIITMSPCFALALWLLSSPTPSSLPALWLSCCPAVLLSCCPGRRLSQFFCSSPASSHLLLAVFATFPCGLQREIRFSYDQDDQAHHHEHMPQPADPLYDSLGTPLFTPLLYYDYLRSCACRLPSSCHGLSLASSALAHQMANSYPTPYTPPPPTSLLTGGRGGGKEKQGESERDLASGSSRQCSCLTLASSSTLDTDHADSVSLL